MLFNFASNAVLAKAHAMYGKRLKEEDYKALLQKKSVGEIADYLKDNTIYSSVLDSAATGSMHRAQLEALLRQNLFSQYEALSIYEMSAGKKLYNFFVVRGDIEQILSVVRLLHSRSPDEYLFQMPDFFLNHSSIDLIQLSKSQNMSDVLEALDGTPYHDIVSSLYKKDMKKISLVELEKELNRYMYRYILSIIDSAYKGKQKEEIKDVLATTLDIQMITIIYRLKKMFDVPPVDIKNLIFTQISALSDKQIHSILWAPSADKMMEEVHKTPYGKHLKKYPNDYIENATQEVVYSKTMHSFRYSTNPTVVMLSYFSIAEIELSNLIRIIEGVRYGIAAEKIKSLLIGIP